MEMVQAGYQIPIDIIVELSDLPDKKRIMQRLAEFQQQQQEAERQKQEAEIQKTLIAAQAKGGGAAPAPAPNLTGG